MDLVRYQDLHLQFISKLGVDRRVRMFTYLAVSFWRILGHSVHWSGAWEWMDKVTESSGPYVYL